MKNNVLFLVAVFFLIGNGFSQVSVPSGELLFEDTISLSPLHEWIIIPSPDSNIWQIGKPVKTHFDSARTGDIAIVTDTLNYYPSNIDNHFLLSLPAFDSLWAEGILSFYHKYNTDTLNDGAFIEISYDRGQTWKNILSDLVQISTNFIGLYDEFDTIQGSIPAFSGSTAEWKYVELHWIWLALTKKSASEQLGRPTLKFRFKSDSSSTDKDGWIIDDIVFRAYDVSGKIKKTSKYEINVYPNPANEFLTVDIPAKLAKCSINIYSFNGQLEIQESIGNSTIIDISGLSNGLYYFEIVKNHNTINTGTIVKY